MYSKLDRELGERMIELARQMPFTNAASSRQSLGELLPGVPMGGCTKLCKALTDSLAGISSRSRLHRAFLTDDCDTRNGIPGDHTLVVIETTEGEKLLDPFLLHVAPFDLRKNDDCIRSHLRARNHDFALVYFERDSNLLEVTCPFVTPRLGGSLVYDFDISPEQAVTATGLESAGINFSHYLIRLVLEGSVVNVIYNFKGKGDVFWLQKGEEVRIVECLTGLGSQSQRQKFDRILRPFELDLPTTIQFLCSAPEWSEEFNRRASLTR